MAARKAQKGLIQRTPVAEWIAAALGLALTLGLVGYTIWEGVTADPGPPRLSVSAGPATRSGTGYVVPLVVQNASHATAAQVEVRGVLRRPGEAPEERHATFSYVPGRGEARGGLVFQADPAASPPDVSVEGWEDP
jgi:uncharacterized protein (TIGR02588 family)